MAEITTSEGLNPVPPDIMAEEFLEYLRMRRNAMFYLGDRPDLAKFIAGIEEKTICHMAVRLKLTDHP